MSESKVRNVDHDSVNGFGEEWHTFDQSELEPAELFIIYRQYFHIFPWDRLGQESIGADIGCGSGRWANIVAPNVKKLHLIDASEKALAVAERKLQGHSNCEFSLSSVGDLPFPNDYLDFAYSLGVLHHVPDTQKALIEISRVLKKDAYLLVYLYYAFDNRGPVFKFVWKISDIFRGMISRLPFKIRLAVCQVIAVSIYWPMARFSNILKALGFPLDSWPLSSYRKRTLYVMRNDALDRFGTRLEHRYTRAEIDLMLKKAGFTDIKFSESSPYWCAVARKGG